MKTKVFLLASMLILFVQFSCNPIELKPKTIGQIDFNDYREEFLAAQSQEDVQRLDSLMFSIIKDSSINRVLPQVWATDQYGVKVNLKMVVDKPSMMVITSPFAQWNSVELARELPDAVASFGNEKRVICLLIEEPAPSGEEMPDDFYKVQLEQLSALFPNTYKISGKEAQKLNIYALPSRYYFNQLGSLIMLNKGAVPYSRLLREIEEFNSISNK